MPLLRIMARMWATIKSFDCVHLKCENEMSVSFSTLFFKLDLWFPLCSLSFDKQFVMASLLFLLIPLFSSLSRIAFDV